MALFPFRNPITEATGCFGGIVIHMCTWSGMRCLPEFDIPSAGPRHRTQDPIVDECFQKSPSAAAWAQTRHGTCSPTWSGLGFDTVLTFILLEDSSSHLEEDPTLGTVKPLRVTLG